MANIIIGKVYACTNHFFIENTLGVGVKVSREMLHFNQIEKINQFHDPTKADYEGEIYAYFSGKNQLANFNLDATEGLPDPVNDHYAIEFYPAGSLVGATGIVVTSNKVFAEYLYIAMGADNAAISF